MPAFTSRTTIGPPAKCHPDKKFIKNKNIQIAAFVMTIIESMVPGWSRMFDELDGILTGNTNDITPVGSLWDALAILGTIACALF